MEVGGHGTLGERCELASGEGGDLAADQCY